MAEHENKNRNTGAGPAGGVASHAIVWLALLALTAASVCIAGLAPGRAAAVSCLVVSAIQSLLVLLYFMHLRHEKNRLIRLAVPITFVLLALFIGGTFLDVITR